MTGGRRVLACLLVAGLFLCLGRAFQYCRERVWWEQPPRGIGGLIWARQQLFRPLLDEVEAGQCVGFTSELDPRDWRRKDHLFGLRFALAPTCVEELDKLRQLGLPDPPMVVRFEPVEPFLGPEPHDWHMWAWEPRPTEVRLEGYTLNRYLSATVEIWKLEGAR